MRPWLLCNKNYFVIQKKHWPPWCFCYLALKAFLWHVRLIFSLPFVWLGHVVKHILIWNYCGFCSAIFQLIMAQSFLFNLKGSVGCMGYRFFIVLCNGCFSLHQYDLRWKMAIGNALQIFKHTNIGFVHPNWWLQVSSKL